MSEITVHLSLSLIDLFFILTFIFFGLWRSRLERTEDVTADGLQTELKIVRERNKTLECQVRTCSSSFDIFTDVILVESI